MRKLTIVAMEARCAAKTCGGRRWFCAIEDWERERETDGKGGLTTEALRQRLQPIELVCGGSQSKERQNFYQWVSRMQNEERERDWENMWVGGGSHAAIRLILGGLLLTQIYTYIYILAYTFPFFFFFPFKFKVSIKCLIKKTSNP